MNKEEKALVVEEYEKIWGVDNKRVANYAKEVSGIYVFENGQFLVYNKTIIEKRFCFGYRCSRDDGDDYQNAIDGQEKAEKDTSYFIKENLSTINDLIDGYKKNDLYIYGTNFTGGEKQIYLKNTFGILRMDQKLEDYVKVSDADKEGLIAFLEDEKAKQLKKVNTYLKRYGLSKVHAWTYCSDD